MALAQQTNGVIINADASQVYRDLRAITARPSVADEAAAEHRLYGHVDGATTCSAADWAEDARATIAAVMAEGRLPILTGGTGLYMRTLLDGIAPVPAIDAGVRAAIEPIRVDETSIVHSCADAAELIEMVDHPGVQHIAGDVYHMLSSDGHVGKALLDYAPRMANLHLADSNRRALGTGQLDIDVVIMALYATGFNVGEQFCTAEPLGGGANPYDAMHGRPDLPVVEALVQQTADTWRAREAAVLAASDEELLAVTGGVVGA